MDKYSPEFWSIHILLVVTPQNVEKLRLHCPLSNPPSLRMHILVGKKVRERCHKGRGGEEKGLGREEGWEGRKGEEKQKVDAKIGFRGFRHAVQNN